MFGLGRTCSRRSMACVRGSEIPNQRLSGKSLTKAFSRRPVVAADAHPYALRGFARWTVGREGSMPEPVFAKALVVSSRPRFSGFLVSAWAWAQDKSAPSLPV